MGNEELAVAEAAEEVAEAAETTVEIEDTTALVQENTPEEEAADPVVTADEVAIEVPSVDEDTSPVATTDETPEQAEPIRADSSETEVAATTDSDSSGNIHSLEIGQRLTGTVKNIADFGAFVDVGISQDGLVHISKLAKHKVEKVSDVVSQGQEVEVWVKKVDTKRGRLSLTMIKPVLRRLRDIEEEAEIEGTVTRLESYGAFVDIDSDRDGLVHISQITHDYIKHPEEALKVGDKIKVKVLSVNRKKRQVDLSIKALLPEPIKEVVEEKPREERARPQRRRSQKPKEQFVMPESDSEPMMTAMAVAYAALQGKDDEDDGQDSSVLAEARQQKGSDMDEIVARTLASREK